MAQDSVEIPLWLDTTGGAENAECIVEHAVDTFNALGNGTTVEATLQANNWDATRPRSPAAPARTSSARLVRRSPCSLPWPGSLLPLDDYAEQFGWNERFAEGRSTSAWPMASSTASPTEIETLVLYYNKTLFEQNGWSRRRRWTS